jgi:hypothetical protein
MCTRLSLKFACLRTYFSEAGEDSPRGVEGQFDPSNWPICESVKSIIY